MAFVTSSKEASRGGFSNIKTIKGTVVKIDEVAAPPTWQTTKSQIKIWLENAQIIDKFDPDDEFELKEGKFEFQYPYAEPGKKPSAIGPYMRCLIMPLEKAGKKLEDLLHQEVTFTKKEMEAGFDQKDKDTGAKTKVTYTQYFVPVEDEGVANVNTLAYIKAGVKDKNVKQALRWLITDTRAHSMPEFKDALNAGTLAGMLGLTLVNDVFVEQPSA